MKAVEQYFPVLLLQKVVLMHHKASHAQSTTGITRRLHGTYITNTLSNVFTKDFPEINTAVYIVKGAISQIIVLLATHC